MSMWRCPYCATPQAETARCWVCHRSSTTCSTCRHFRQSVAAQVGYCGLDRRRLPLAGSEHRGCWEAATRTPEHGATGTSAATEPVPSARRRDFIPVELARESAIVGLNPGTSGSAPPEGRSVELWRDSQTLFGDLDR